VVLFKIKITYLDLRGTFC